MSTTPISEKIINRAKILSHLNLSLRAIASELGISKSSVKFRALFPSKKRMYWSLSESLKTTDLRQSTLWGGTVNYLYLSTVQRSFSRLLPRTRSA